MITLWPYNDKRNTEDYEKEYQPGTAATRDFRLQLYMAINAHTTITSRNDIFRSYDLMFSSHLVK